MANAKFVECDKCNGGGLMPIEALAERDAELQEARAALASLLRISELATAELSTHGFDLEAAFSEARAVLSTGERGEGSQE